MNLSGIIVAPITAMSDDGQSLASDVIFHTYYQFLIERGVNGMLVGGTTGEGMLLSLDERKTLAEKTVRIVNHAVPVLIHVGANSTADAVQLAKHAAMIKADGIAVVSPSFYSYDQPALATHFTAVAKTVPDLPMYLYNLPSFVHNELLADLVVELQHTCPNIVGVKHSDEDMIRLQEYRRMSDPDFCILSGDDALEYAALSLGANGCVSGKSSAFPEVTTALFRAFHANDLKTARQQQIKIDMLATVLDLGIGIGLAYFKAALRWRGLDVGNVRAPQRWLTSEEESALKIGLNQLQRQGYLNDLKPI